MEAKASPGIFPGTRLFLAMLQAWTIICPFTGVKLKDRAEDSSSGSQTDKEQVGVELDR